jgi:hypothetical protein
MDHSSSLSGVEVLSSSGKARTCARFFERNSKSNNSTLTMIQKNPFYPEISGNVKMSRVEAD